MSATPATEDGTVPIEAAARSLGLSVSAVRYYDDAGIVPASGRVRGRRVYGRAALRRLALVSIARTVGIALPTVAAMVDADGDERRRVLDEQVAELDRRIRDAEVARAFLQAARSCPADHPADECPDLVGALDQLVAGRTVQDLAAEHVPPAG